MKISKLIGQKNIKKQLNFLVLPELLKERFCDHILLDGAPGFGKTFLAKIIADEAQLTFIKVMSPIIQTKADLISIFCNITKNSILFFDEIHRLDARIEEMLYQILDERKLNISIGKNGETDFITIDIPNFTFIGATTLSGLISYPFKSRFGFVFSFDEYSSDDIIQIIKQNLKFKLKHSTLLYIANNSKNNPRIAKKISRRINEYFSHNDEKITRKKIHFILKILGFNQGLSKNDIAYLSLLEEHKNLSLNVISQKLEIAQINIISDIEPYLIKKNFISINSSGRKISTKGINFLGNLE